MSEEKIFLRATIKRKGGIRITDQHGRELDLRDPRVMGYGSSEYGHVLAEEPDLEVPYDWMFSDSGPRLNVRFSIPLEIQA